MIYWVISTLAFRSSGPTSERLSDIGRLVMLHIRENWLGQFRIALIGAPTARNVKAQGNALGKNEPI